MGRFISVGHTSHPSTPFVWIPRGTEPRFVSVFTLPQQAITPPTPETAPMFIAPSPASNEADTISLPVTDMNVSVYIAPDVRTPLSQNLLAVRRRLNLSPEEFARPIIEDGEGLINRLEAGFSRPSAEIGNMICEAWGIIASFLYNGIGPMFLKDEAGNSEKYVLLLTRLLKTYLTVATFDQKGNQYWKTSLVDDLGRLIDIAKLDGRGMSRVVRVLYDYLDVDQFAEILERMGR